MKADTSDPQSDRLEVRTLRNRTKQTIPTAVLDELRVREGDVMAFYRTPAGVLIKKVEVSTRA